MTDTVTTSSTAAGNQRCGCPDFTLSRRRFLGGVAASTGAVTAGTLFGDAFRQVSYGAVADGPVVVVLSMRGGSDGLSIVVPKDDLAFLQTVRPDLAVPLDRLVGGNGSWGLHPALAPLVPMWNANQFGAVHGVGLPQPNRSHFDAMELVEEANPGSSARVGWINRVIGLNPDALPEEQIQLGDSMLPTALAGPAPALGAYTVDNFVLPTLGTWIESKSQLTKSHRKIWGGSGTAMNRGFQTALDSVGRLGPAVDLPLNDGGYPDGALKSVLSNTARLIKAKVGARMVAIDYGDWDMHTGLGAAEPGNWMYDHLDHFANAMVAFFADLGADASRVTVVTISEFGRRVEQNGSGGEAGVDHGYGNAMLLLGAGVNGGDVRGSWQPLQGNLNDGDVPLNHDYRSVLWEVLHSRYAADVSGKRTKIFPGFSNPETLGSMT